MILLVGGTVSQARDYAEQRDWPAAAHSVHNVCSAINAVLAAGNPERLVVQLCGTWYCDRDSGELLALCGRRGVEVAR